MAEDRVARGGRSDGSERGGYSNEGHSRDGPEYVTLVDEADVPIGTAEKMRAHREGLLHRACSVILFNANGELLLQKRSPDKYHSGGLWSNACCTHPRPGETTADAAVRRLYEEMGIETGLRQLFNLVYRLELDNDLIEHEYDHVFGGRSGDEPRPNAHEVIDWRWASLENVAADLERNPSEYTRWFPLLFERLQTMDVR